MQIALETTVPRVKLFIEYGRWEPDDARYRVSKFSDEAVEMVYSTISAMIARRRDKAAEDNSLRADTPD